MAQPDNNKKGSLKYKDGSKWEKRSLVLERGVLVVQKEKDPTPLVTIPAEEFSEGGIFAKGKDFYIETKNNTRHEFRTKTNGDAQDWTTALIAAQQATSRPHLTTPSRPSALPPPSFTTAEKRSAMEKKESAIDGFGSARAKMTDRSRPVLGSSFPTSSSSVASMLPPVVNTQTARGHEEKSRGNEDESRGNDEKVEKLQQQLQEANKNLQLHKDQIHQLQTEVTKKEQNSEKLEAQLVELRGQLKGKDSEVDSLKESIKLKAAETASLHSQLNEASTHSTSVSEQQKNIESMTLKMNHQEEKIGTLDALVSKLTLEKEQKEQKINSQLKTIQKQNTELQEKEHTISEIKGTLEKKEKEYHSLSAQIRENQNQNSDKGNQLEAKNNEYNQLLIKFQDMKSQMDILKSERDNFQSKSTEKTAELLKKEKELLSDRKTIEDLDRENKLKDHKIDQLTRSTEDLKRQVTESSERINSIMNTGNSDTQVTELLAQVDAKTREVREKNLVLDAKENALCEMKIRCDELQQKNLEFSEKLELKENQVKSLLEEMDNVKKKLNETQIALNHALQENTLHIQKINQNLSENKDKNTIPTKEDKALQLLVDNLRKELQSKQEAETSRKAEIETLNQKLKKKNAKIASLKSVQNNNTEKTRQTNFPNLGFVTSPEGVAEQIKEKFESVDSSPVHASEAKLRSLEVIKRAIETENTAKDKCIALLNQTIKSQSEKIETVVQLETRIERLEKKISRKQDQITELKNSVYLSRKREIQLEQMADGTQSSVTIALREELEAKETTLQNIREKLDAAYETITEPENLIRQNNELKQTIQLLKLDLELRKRELDETKKATAELRVLFNQAYENGTEPKGFEEEKVRKIENALKLVEGQLGKVTADRDRLILELRKMERALESAKKVALIEYNFLDLLKKVDAKLKDKKDVTQELRMRIQKDTEEKKTLLSKINVLKTSYQKLLEDRENDRKEFSAMLDAKTKQLEISVKRLKAELGRIKKTDPSSIPDTNQLDNSPRRTKDKKTTNDQSPRKKRSKSEIKNLSSPIVGSSPAITPRTSESVAVGPGQSGRLSPGYVAEGGSLADMELKTQTVPQLGVIEGVGSFDGLIKTRSEMVTVKRTTREPHGKVLVGAKKSSHNVPEVSTGSDLMDKPGGNSFDDA